MEPLLLRKIKDHILSVKAVYYTLTQIYVDCLAATSTVCDYYDSSKEGAD